MNTEIAIPSARVCTAASPDHCQLKQIIDATRGFWYIICMLHALKKMEELFKDEKTNNKLNINHNVNSFAERGACTGGKSADI